MAKKIDELKTEMGFSKEAPMCGNCKHFTSERETILDWANREYSKEVKLRCGLGGFKVGKSNWCQKYQHK